MAHPDEIHELMKQEQFCGIVVAGLQNGRKLGFPTANVQLFGEKKPKDGVYAAKCWVDGKCYKAMLSVGARPTFGLTEPTIELHLCGFDKCIYGAELTFEIVKKIAQQQAFPSVEALKERLQQYKNQILSDEM